MEILPGAIVAKTIYEQVADLEAELASATRDQKETQRDLDALYEVARRMGGEMIALSNEKDTEKRAEHFRTMGGRLLSLKKKRGDNNR